MITTIPGVSLYDKCRNMEIYIENREYIGVYLYLIMEQFVY
jgi:hypothetical protein